jgi:hypothetical protein
LWQLLRTSSLRWARPIGGCWVFLVVAFTVLGGKPYYLSGMFPVLFAAGAEPSLEWMRRKRGRRVGVTIGAAVSVLIALPITLPLVPVGDLHNTSVVDANYDAGETVGWPAYVEEIAAVQGRLLASGTGGASVEILASNYGEAGAVDRYGPARGLPPAFSGHMGYWWWGPPAGARPEAVIAVGFGRDFLLRSFGSVTLAARLDNHVDVDDDEQGGSVWVCTGMRADWVTLWPDFKSVG